MLRCGNESVVSIFRVEEGAKQGTSVTPDGKKLFHAGFLLVLFFDHEDGGDMSETSGDFQPTTRSYIPEGRTLQ
jgi:hypothetical protein